MPAAFDGMVAFKKVLAGKVYDISEQPFLYAYAGSPYELEWLA
jgi:hypothetical protein